MVRGIMTVPHLNFGEDTVMENRYILTNTENLKVGNITEKHNGKQHRRIEDKG